MLVSRSSHLPHVVAATLANLILDPAQPKPQAALCANGFRDTTRIASGSPEMWRDIAVANRRNLVRALDAFIGDLQKFQRKLKSRRRESDHGILHTGQAAAATPGVPVALRRHRNDETMDEHGPAATVREQGG